MEKMQKAIDVLKEELSKAKYIRKEPDGKGGFKYIYAEKKPGKEKKDKEDKESIQEKNPLIPRNNEPFFSSEKELQSHIKNLSENTFRLDRGSLRSEYNSLYDRIDNTSRNSVQYKKEKLTLDLMNRLINMQGIRYNSAKDKDNMIKRISKEVYNDYSSGNYLKNKIINHNIDKKEEFK